MSIEELLGELRANFQGFDAQWKSELTNVMKELSSEAAIFEESYRRIASLQAWRTSVVAERMDEDSAAFFFEAQNDLLVSHCLAHSGSFRQALKSLRSCIENVYFSLFYMDHPVELARWAAGNYKIGFTELQTYFEAHPSLEGTSPQKNGLAVIKEEYATLSKAVHASAKHFRMTTDLSDTKLWVNDAASVGKWSTRERNVVNALNCLLLYLFASFVRGAKNPGLRTIVGLNIPKSRHASIKNELGVNLISK